MSGKSLMASVVCLGLAACGTDKIAMSSEVGGGGSSRIVAARADNSGGGGAGAGGSGGLGVTGGGGALDNIVGTDPVGGYVDELLGPGNPVTAILGSSGGSGLVPSAAAMLAGDPDAEVTGLGIAGEGGLLADLAGTDMLGGMLDTGGLVGASIAGGNDGLLGALLNSQAANPPLAPIAGPVASALPVSVLADALAGLPALGVTGSGGLVADLTGTDVAGNLLGQSTPAGGGNGGLLGNLVPASQPPLGQVGQAGTGLLNIVGGNEPSPVSGILAPAMPVLDNILGTGAGTIGGAIAPVTGALSGLPVGGTPSSGGSSPAPAPAPASGPLAPVTGIVGGLPIVGGLLRGQ
ncbi:hypothetical protein [Parvibaculum lavamentivorans]|nr:hypothetical protein [Parvibaculum lavamentivorans]